ILRNLRFNSPGAIPLKPYCNQGEYLLGKDSPLKGISQHIQVREVYTLLTNGLAMVGWSNRHAATRSVVNCCFKVKITGA
mgnify:CR=1